MYLAKYNTAPVITEINAPCERLYIMPPSSMKFEIMPNERKKAIINKKIALIESFERSSMKGNPTPPLELASSNPYIPSESKKY